MDKLVQEAQQLFGIHLTGRQVVALMTFERELLAWNEKFNLTAIRDREGIRTKHFLDSFSCVLAWKENPPRRLIDIGTGAGFPGIPLEDPVPVHAADAGRIGGKESQFLPAHGRNLNLEATEVITARCEDVGQMPAHREANDWAVARAVANLPVLAEYLSSPGAGGGSHAGPKRPKRSSGNS